MMSTITHRTDIVFTYIVYVYLNFQFEKWIFFFMMMTLELCINVKDFGKKVQWEFIGKDRNFFEKKKKV